MIARDEPLRIGVYICHCGSNIAGVIDVEALAAWAGEQPHVALSRHYKYMCSDPGQELVKRDIREFNLNRIVVAACSPNLHEPTFRRAAENAGLNRFLVQMANIREQVSWVTDDHAAAYTKAQRAPGRRDRPSCQARALAAAVRADPTAGARGGWRHRRDSGRLDDGRRRQGGHSRRTRSEHRRAYGHVRQDVSHARLRRLHPDPENDQRPTAPEHQVADLLHGRVGGRIGGELPCQDPAATAVRRRKPLRRLHAVHRGLCFHPRKFANPFDQGLGTRKPVWLPFAQAVPPIPVIDPETCLEIARGKCKQGCVEACGERDAIRFNQQETIEEYDVGAIVVTTGFQAFDPSVIPYYGYGRLPNVFTSLEIERLLNAGGPTSGKLTLRDGSPPKSVGIVHCVGSRDANHHKYCSRVCCMYALKMAHLVREKTGAEIYNCYIDIRTPGKGFEEFYNRVQDEGVHFIRGKVADISFADGGGAGGEGRLTMQVDDTLLGSLRKLEVDMVILAVALEPQSDAADVRRTFGISCSGEGFFLEKHPEACAGQHGQRWRVRGRSLPRPQGHPGHGGAGGRRGGPSLGIDRCRPDRTGAQHRLDRRADVLGLQDLSLALPVPGDQPGRGAADCRDRSDAVQGLRDVCGRLPVGCRQATSVQRRTSSRRAGRANVPCLMQLFPRPSRRSSL